jgi:hypothetical protein
MRRPSSRTHHRHTRRLARLPCQVVRERDFRLVADTIANLSPTGLLVTPADPVLTGERLLVSFQVPGSSLWIDTEATVTRVVHGRRPGEYSRALGLEFDPLPIAAKLALEHSLGRLMPVPPGARPGRRVVPLELLTSLFT